MSPRSFILSKSVCHKLYFVFVIACEGDPSSALNNESKCRQILCGYAREWVKFMWRSVRSTIDAVVDIGVFLNGTTISVDCFSACAERICLLKCSFVWKLIQAGYFGVSWIIKIISVDLPNNSRCLDLNETNRSMDVIRVDCGKILVHV